jgi:hypothetical protein
MGCPSFSKWTNKRRFRSNTESELWKCLYKSKAERPS